MTRPDNKKDFLALTDDEKWALLVECYGIIAQLGEELDFAEQELQLRDENLNNPESAESAADR